MGTSQSEAMVLSWKRVECSLQSRDKLLPPMENFKNLKVSFISEGRLGQDIDKWTVLVTSVM